MQASANEPSLSASVVSQYGLVPPLLVVIWVIAVETAACWSCVMPDVLNCTSVVEDEPSEPVISAICAGVRPASITIVPVTTTVVVPEMPAESCVESIPVASIVASPLGVLVTSAAISLALLPAPIVTSLISATAPMPAATADSCDAPIPRPSMVTTAPPVKFVPPWTWPRIAAICTLLSADVIVNVPTMPFVAMCDALSATAMS